MIGKTSLYKQIRQHIHHIIGFKTKTNTQRQTFPRIFINHRQNADFTSIDKSFGHKIITPHMIGPARLEPDARPIVQIKSTALFVTLRNF